MALRYAALAALATSLWTAILAFTAVPVYLSRLGIEAIGIVGFFVTTQAVLQILDLGLAPAINRELARASALGQMDFARTLLRTLSLIYWVAAGLIAVAFCFAAGPIAKFWLGSSRLTTGELTQALTLMGLVIAARWPIAVYQNALIGLGRLGVASAITAVMTTLTVAASIACVLYVSPTLPSLFLSQAIGTLLYAIVIRVFAWRALGGAKNARVRWDAVRKIWKFSVGMSGVTLTSIGLTQLDKTLLSRLLPLETFGEYMLASTVVGGLVVVVGPLFSIIYPRFSALVANGKVGAAQTIYDHGSRLFAIVYLPLVIGLGVYALDIVTLWTGHAETASRVAPLVTLLCIGSGINGIMYFPYAMQLAHGLSWIPLFINGVLLVLLVPLVFVLTSRYGASGGAMAWAGLEILYVGFGAFMNSRFLPMGSAATWIWRSLVAPLAVSAVVAAALHPLIDLAPAASVLKIFLVALSILLSPVFALLFFADSRAIVLRQVKNRRAILLTA